MYGAGSADSLHRQCALELFSVYAEATSALGNTGNQLEHLVVILNHTTKAADAQYQALQAVSEAFAGPAYAWGGDAEEEEPTDLSGTPTPHVEHMKRAV